jgi:hypothetical protein
MGFFEALLTKPDTDRGLECEPQRKLYLLGHGLYADFDISCDEWSVPCHRASYRKVVKG